MVPNAYYFFRPQNPKTNKCSYYWLTYHFSHILSWTNLQPFSVTLIIFPLRNQFELQSPFHFARLRSPTFLQFVELLLNLFSPSLIQTVSLFFLSSSLIFSSPFYSKKFGWWSGKNGTFCWKIHTFLEFSLLFRSTSRVREDYPRPFFFNILLHVLS